MKRKTTLHIIGIVLVFLTFIPPLPSALKLLLALLPFAVFTAEMLLNCIQNFIKKNFFSEYLAFSLVSVGIMSTGRVTDAALTVTLCSLALTLFKSSYEKTQNQVDELCRIIPHKARLLTPDGVKSVRLSEIKQGDTLVIKNGDIIPADGVITNGEGIIDYTNIFGPSKTLETNIGGKCYSGGILTEGRITIMAAFTADHSIASVMESKTRRAHTSSPVQAKVSVVANIYRPALMLLSLIIFIALFIATRQFGYAMNVASVIMIASATLSMTKVLPLAYHISLLKARKKGVIFTNTDSLERLARVQTLCPNEKTEDEILAAIEETGIIPARNGSTELDASVYRSKAMLESQNTPVYKIALGFFSPKADMTVYDSNMERIPGAVRVSSSLRGTVLENSVCIITEKLALIALVFLLNITPALAILIELAAWMICLINATKKR